MSERLFVLYTLKAGASRDDYIHWLQREHYPWGRSLTSQFNVREFSVVDDYDPAIDQPEWDYIAVIDIDDRRQWEAEMQAHPDAQHHGDKWGAYVERYKIFFTTSVHA